MSFFSKIKILSFYSFLGTALILTGCGGGGGGSSTPALPTYSGSTSPAAIDSSNADAIGTTTTEASIQLISGQNAQDANPFGISITNNTSFFTDTMPDLIKNILDGMQNGNLPVGITLGSDFLTGMPGYCGGSITVPDNFVPGATTYSINMTFNNYCFDDGVQQVFLNGTITNDVTPSTMTSSYINFSVKIGGVTETINMSLSCTGMDTVPSCTISIIYTGSDGKTYQVANFTVTANATDYQIEATFYHPTHGTVTMSSTNLAFVGCTNGMPSSGMISFNSDSSSGTITFTSCTTYDVTWNDGAVDVGMSRGTWP